MSGAEPLLRRNTVIVDSEDERGYEQLPPVP
jgi:hypothetical protein